jgi:hypothetical protein
MRAVLGIIGGLLTLWEAFWRLLDLYVRRAAARPMPA